jgi:hypothetical protein
MATLNKLAYQVASSFDRDSDFLFIERLKDLIIQTRNQFVHREIDKYGVNEKYVQPYIAELTLVNASMDSTIDSRYELLRTTNKIPSPIRYQTDVPFIFVGSVDRMIGFRNIKSYIMKSSRSLRFIGSAICYFYSNGYIYIWNSTKLENVLVEAVYEELDVTQDNDDTTGLCYKDDMEFPLAGDMLNDVIKEVINIIRATQDQTDKNPVTTRDIN